GGQRQRRGVGDGVDVAGGRLLVVVGGGDARRAGGAAQGGGVPQGGVAVEERRHVVVAQVEGVLARNPIGTEEDQLTGRGRDGVWHGGRGKRKKAKGNRTPVFVCLLPRSFVLPPRGGGTLRRGGPAKMSRSPGPVRTGRIPGEADRKHPAGDARWPRNTKPAPPSPCRSPT